MKLPAGLVYSHADDPGITRRKRGKGYSFQYPDGNTVTSKPERQRLLSLAVPPAYTRVWYCPLENGHLQATGLDARGRKQYRYHEEWSRWRGEIKFDGLEEFGLALPKLRRAMDRAMQGKSLSRERVLGAVAKLLDKTAARIGNETYYQENGTSGLTTLRKKHAATEGTRIHLSYLAKSGKEREFDLSHPTLAKIISRMEDLPGQRLFKYRENGDLCAIESTHVNEWLKEKSALEDISAKNFRTWHASRLTLTSLLGCKPAKTKKARIAQENEVLLDTSKVLGHRPPVCRKHYVHPGILTAHREGKLQAIFSKKMKPITGLATEESNLVCFLRTSAL